MKKRYILRYNHGHKEGFFRISGKKDLESCSLTMIVIFSIIFTLIHPGSLFPILISHDFAIPHGDNTVKILLVPFLVGDHHHGLVKILVEFPDQFQDQSSSSGYRDWHRAHRQGGSPGC